MCEDQSVLTFCPSYSGCESDDMDADVCLPGSAAIAIKPKKSPFQASRGCHEGAAQSREGCNAAL